MEHQTKQYSRFSGEMLRLEEIFSKSLSNFHYLNDLTQQHFHTGHPALCKSQQDVCFCWLFFTSQSLKNTT
jgi:hypothetical protein